MPRIHLGSFVPVLLFCLLGWGCSEQAPAPPPPAKKAASPKPATAVKSTPEDAAVAPTKYVYNPVGRRDPFENPLKDIVVPLGQETESLTPLQKVDLGQLRLAGIIIGRGEPTAMVIGPGGKSFILKKGVKIGKNSGVVVSIQPDSVTIREKYFDFSGEVRTSDKQLQLPKRGGVN